MMIPGLAPFTPDFQESLAFANRPCWSSNASSPMYQTLPCLSWAYQSNVRSTRFPCSDTVSRTTVQRMPRICFVWRVTTMSSVWGVLPLTPLKWKPVPGFNGKYRLSTAVTKFAGSLFGDYVPWIDARLDADCGTVVCAVADGCRLVWSDEP